MRRSSIQLSIICLALTVSTGAAIVSAKRAGHNASPSAAFSHGGVRRSPGAAQGQGTPQDFSKNTWDLPADADQTKNPVTANDESIAKGKDMFMTRQGNCVFCHGETGAGNEANFPKLRRKPADLSNSVRMPKLSDGELYWKITRGITGIMPSYDDPKLTAEERWHLVNFVRTLAKPKS